MYLDGQIQYVTTITQTVKYPFKMNPYLACLIIVSLLQLRYCVQHQSTSYWLPATIVIAT